MKPLICFLHPEAARDVRRTMASDLTVRINDAIDVAIVRGRNPGEAAAHVVLEAQHKWATRNVVEHHEFSELIDAFAKEALTEKPSMAEWIDDDPLGDSNGA